MWGGGVGQNKTIARKCGHLLIKFPQPSAPIHIKKKSGKGPGHGIAAAGVFKEDVIRDYYSIIKLI